MKRIDMFEITELKKQTWYGIKASILTLFIVIKTTIGSIGQTIETGAWPQLEVQEEGECGTGTLRYEIRGGSELCWPGKVLGEGGIGDPRGWLEAEIEWTGNHHVAILDTNGHEWYNESWKMEDFTGVEAYKTKGEYKEDCWCTRIEYGEALRMNVREGEISELPSGRYYLYYWLDYELRARYSGGEFKLEGTIGKQPDTSSPSEAAGTYVSEVVLENKGEIFPYKIRELRYNDQAFPLWPIFRYPCEEVGRVDIEFENIPPEYIGTFKVHIYWGGPLISCNREVESYQGPAINNLETVLDSITMQPTNVLRIPELRNPGVLLNNPLHDNRNAMKYYKIRFDIYSGSCLVGSHTQCVLYADDGTLTTEDFELKGCTQLPICQGLPSWEKFGVSELLVGRNSGAYRSLTEPGFAETLRTVIKSGNLVIYDRTRELEDDEDYDCYVEENGTCWEKLGLLSLYEEYSNPFNEIFLNQHEIPAFDNWPGGPDYFIFYAIQNNLLNYTIELTFTNKCNTKTVIGSFRLQQGVNNRPVDDIHREMVPHHRQETTLEKELRVYPNPVGEELFLESQTLIAGYELYNMQGKLLINAVEHGDKIKIGIYNVPQGVYMLQVQYADGTASVHKIIKQ